MQIYREIKYHAEYMGIILVLLVLALLLAAEQSTTASQQVHLEKYKTILTTIGKATIIATIITIFIIILAFMIIKLWKTIRGE